MVQVEAASSTSGQIRLTRHSSFYWRVTLDIPPLNIFGPQSLPQLNEIVTALETDEEVRVVVGVGEDARDADVRAPDLAREIAVKILRRYNLRRPYGGGCKWQQWQHRRSD